MAPRPSRLGGNGPFTTIIVLSFFILISTHCVSTTEACSCKALYPLPFLKKKSFFPFIVFFHILEENYRKERKKENLYLLSLYLSFWEFSSSSVKEKQYKKGKNVVCFFFKKGFAATSPRDFDNIYILSISPPGYQRVTSQKKGILVTFCILI